MKKTDLVGMIRTLVVEEVRKQLPRVVSEMYIKGIVLEAIGSAAVKQPQQKFEDVFERELSFARDEHVPEPMENSDEGIYQDGPITRKNESVRATLLARENPLLGEMFKGVVPVHMREGAGKPVVPMFGPAEMNPDGGVEMGDPAKYGEIFRKLSGNSSTPMQQTPDAQMRALEEQRRRLDERVVDTRAAPIVK